MSIQTSNELLRLLNEKQEAETKTKQIRERIKSLSGQLKADILNEYDYETAKKIFNEIQFYTKTEVALKMRSIIEKKKIEKYPELLKPTYYPEIDMLSISDSEKLRLDKAARENFNKYISEKNSNKSSGSLSIDDMELLKGIGVSKKIYMFKCRRCRCSCGAISESDLNKYKKIWELESRASSLSEEEFVELDKLQQDGYGNIYLCCMDHDDCDIEITNEEELEKYERNIDVLYKIEKNPNLKFEKL